MRFGTTLVLAGAVAALGGCRQARKAEPDPLRLETRRFERALPGCGDASRRAEPCVTFRVEWPEAVGAKTEEARKRINAAILERLQPAEAAKGFEAEAAEVLEDYERFRAQFPRSPINYFTRRVAEAVRVSPGLLSVEIRSEEFRGGDHPDSRREYVNLDPATGERVELGSLLRGGAMEKLAAVAERRFRAERGLGGGDDLAQAGFTFDNNRFALPKQWGAGARGLILHYNADEIAPYPMGATTFTVPWTELREVLRRDAGLPGF